MELEVLEVDLLPRSLLLFLNEGQALMRSVRHVSLHSLPRKQTHKYAPSPKTPLFSHQHLLGKSRVDEPIKHGQTPGQGHNLLGVKKLVGDRGGGSVFFQAMLL